MVVADASTQVTDLTAEDHACLTFGEAEELFDLIAAFGDSLVPAEVAAGCAGLGLTGVPGIQLVTADDR
jgi:hypothetical protein